MELSCWCGFYKAKYSFAILGVVVNKVIDFTGLHEQNDIC